MKIPLIVETILQTALLVEIKDNTWKQFIEACKDQGEEPKVVLTRFAKSYVIGNNWAKQGEATKP